MNGIPGKDPAAVSLGRKGGKKGVGAAKRRPPEHYARMAGIRAEKKVDERVAHVEQALREAEEQHARELAEARHSLQFYVRCWMKDVGMGAGIPEPLEIPQDWLREVAQEEQERGTRIVFEVQPDGETLRISEVTDPERTAP